MFSEALLFTILMRVLLLTAGIYNVRLAMHEYRHYRDARGLRGFVAALTMLAGVIALVGSSQVLRDSWPEVEAPLRIVTAAGVTMFLIGLAFSCYAWRIGRGPDADTAGDARRRARDV